MITCRIEYNLVPRWWLPPMMERIYSPRRPGSIRTQNWLTGRCWAEQIGPRYSA